MKWIPGTIVQKKGPNTYLVRGFQGISKRFVHVDHLIPDDSTPLERNEGNTQSGSDLVNTEVPHTYPSEYDSIVDARTASPTLNESSPVRSSPNSEATVDRSANKTPSENCYQSQSTVTAM